MTKTRFCHRCGEQIYPGQKFGKSKGKEHHLKPDCAHAGTILEASPIPGDDARFRNRSLPRMLSSRIATSEVDRDCHNCLCELVKMRKRAELAGEAVSRFDFEDLEMYKIYPGDEYLRAVWIVPYGEYWELKSRIELRYYHHPGCPIPHDSGPGRQRRCEVHKISEKSVRRAFRRVA